MWKFALKKKKKEKFPLHLVIVFTYFSDDSVAVWSPAWLKTKPHTCGDQLGGRYNRHSLHLESIFGIWNDTKSFYLHANNVKSWKIKPLRTRYNCALLQDSSSLPYRGSLSNLALLQPHWTCWMLAIEVTAPSCACVEKHTGPARCSERWLLLLPGGGGIAPFI